MKNKSIWSNYLNNNDIKVIDEDKNVDIVIIGGGITGLSIAYSFLNDNYKVCLLEKNIIGSGITSKSTAKITYLQDGIYEKINKIRNYECAKLYYEFQREAIDKIIDIIDSNNIDCDKQESDSYLFTFSNTKKLDKEKELLTSFGCNVESITILPDGLKGKRGIKCGETYTFNPIKYLNGLKEIIKDKIPIYENSCVKKIIKNKDYYLVRSNNHTIKTKYVILCTHYPYFLFPYLMPLKCSLEKSYIALIKDDSNNNFQAITNELPTLSIRYVKDKYKLILINSNNLAYSQNDADNFKKLIKLKPEYVWSNIDIITKDYLPYIGEIDNNLYIATGYNTWGMTNSMVACSVIHDLIANKNNKYSNLVNPKRKNNLSISIKYPLYLINNMYSFINSKTIKNKNWYTDHIRFTKIKGVNVGIYTDDNGEEHIVINKCPHLGCSLIFNETELTWDCPCHGSRFDLSGKSIEGPSNYNITYKQQK